MRWISPENVSIFSLKQLSVIFADVGHKRQLQPPPWFASTALATSCTLPRFQTARSDSGTGGIDRPSAPCLNAWLGIEPPLELSCTSPPPANPHPDPITGAVPGDLHGLVRLQSRADFSLTLTLYVRYFGMFRIGSPGISTGCENQKQAEFWQSPAS